MFDLNLLARDVKSGETFVVGLSSLPSVHGLLEGIKNFVEVKYNLTFPSIPDLFYTHEDLHPTSPYVPLHAALGNPCLSSSISPVPETSLPEAPLTPAPLPSEVKPEPSHPLGKVLCSSCKKLISKSNWARHEKYHADELKCEGICQFVTKNPDTMIKHKLSDTCLRYNFACNFQCLATVIST